MKTIPVRVNGSLATAMGASRFVVQLPEAATLSELITTLAQRYPTSTDSLSRAVAVVGGKHIPATAILTKDEEVALLMPISGG